MGDLVPLPEQPGNVPWPTERWPQAEVPVGVDADELAAILDPAFSEPQPEATIQTNDLVIVHRGRIVAERYATGFGPDDTQPSWSMAKSILQAAVGILVRDGRLDIDAPAAVPEWREPGDPRAKITLNQLLHMTDGLRFAEDYVDAGVSDVIKMLFEPGADDTGGFAASYPLDYEPDTHFNYSSGTSNIIARIVRDVVGPNEWCADFMRQQLFGPIGMTTAELKFDAAGTWIGSSYCFATPRDFARFGLLYLRDGVWDGRRVLPEGWVDYARTPAPCQPFENERGYGAHWWLWEDGLGTFLASGYVFQLICIVPALDLIIVRNGNTPVARRLHVVRMVRQIIDLFRRAEGF